MRYALSEFPLLACTDILLATTGSHLGGFWLRSENLKPLAALKPWSLSMAHLSGGGTADRVVVTFNSWPYGWGPCIFEGIRS